MSDRERRIHELTYSCESRTEMCERVVDMEDECERLRSYLSDASESAKLILGENAKLRELCVDMWTCVREGEWDCSDCPRYARCDDGVSEFKYRMRELGIGVDE